MFAVLKQTESTTEEALNIAETLNVDPLAALIAIEEGALIGEGE